MTRYVVIFGDGGISYARPWESMLRMVERTLKLPPTFHPRLVVRVDDRLANLVGKGA